MDVLLSEQEIMSEKSVSDQPGTRTHRKTKILSPRLNSSIFHDTGKGKERKLSHKPQPAKHPGGEQPTGRRASPHPSVADARGESQALRNRGRREEATAPDNLPLLLATANSPARPSKNRSGKKKTFSGTSAKTIHRGVTLRLRRSRAKRKLQSVETGGQQTTKASDGFTHLPFTHSCLFLPQFRCI